MLLTQEQCKRFWREWSTIVARNDWDKAAAETKRHELLTRAGFDSLKLVDRTEGFSRVLKELAALRDDLGAMLHADSNNRRVLLYSIKNRAARIVRRSPFTHPSAEHYIHKITLDKFGTIDLDALQEHQLRELLMTLSSRLRSKSKKEEPAPELLDNAPF